MDLFSHDGGAWHLTLMNWLKSLILGFWLAFGIVTFIFAVIERGVRYHEQSRK
jgi:hypothetical protein